MLKTGKNYLITFNKITFVTTVMGDCMNFIEGQYLIGKFHFFEAAIGRFWFDIEHPIQSFVAVPKSEAITFEEIVEYGEFIKQ